MKKIIIDSLSGQIRSIVVNNGKPEEIYVENTGTTPEAGTVYTGRIEKIVSGDFAFINIGAEKNAFMEIKGKSFKQGDAVVVQVKREAYGTKGAYVSTELSFSGRYIVINNTAGAVGVSSKIKDEEKRKYLKKLMREHLPQGYGCIARTNSTEATDDMIVEEINNLCAVAEKVINTGKYAVPPYELFREYTETEKAIRDYLDPREDIAVVNDEAFYDDLKEKFPNYNIQLYTDKLPIFQAYMLDSCIDKALAKKVWLDCGGFLIIEYTEAMTVIDVNTGKYSGKDKDTTVFRTNMEAAYEIPRQLRLRNISGMIIVDFIDMKNRENLDKVCYALNEALKADRVKTVVVGMTELGLMQITRKKIHKPLHTILKQPCGICMGTGMTDSPTYVTEKIKNKLRYIFTNTVYKNITVTASEEVINMLKRYNIPKVFEETFGGRIYLNSVKTRTPEYFNIESDI